MRIKILVFLTLLTTITANAQLRRWTSVLGGSGNESANSVTQLKDGSFVTVGPSNSSDGDVSDHYFYEDFWIVKHNAKGGKIWDAIWGGNGKDIPYSVQATADGGFIVTGVTNSVDIEVNHRHTKYMPITGGDSVLVTNDEFWVLKLDSGGKHEWNIALGGYGNETAYSIKQTKEGGYIVVGTTTSPNDGDVSGVHGPTDSYGFKKSDFWVVKLSATGSLQWSKAYGGSRDDIAKDVVQTADGGYIITGTTLSTDGDVTPKTGFTDTTFSNIWVIKINGSGALQWNTVYGGSDIDVANALALSKDGNSVTIAGHTYSDDGDVSGIMGAADIWLLNISNNGALNWNKFYGGSHYEFGNTIYPTNDGGYIVGGQTYSNNLTGDLNWLRLGMHDGWIFKTNSSGSIQWDRSLGGGTGDDEIFSIVQTQDNGFVVAGNSTSSDFDPKGNKGGKDMFIVKLPDVRTYPNQATICGSGSYIFKHIFSGWQYYDPNWGQMVLLTDTLTKPGKYYQVYNLGAYDSTIVLTLDKVSLELFIYSLNDSTITSDAKNVSYQWIDCKTKQRVEGATGKTFTPAVSGEYAVVVTEGTCSDTTDCLEVIRSGSSSIAELMDAHIRMYPNPVAGKSFTVEVGAVMQGKAEISIYDVEGREVLSQSVNTAEGKQIHVTLPSNVRPGIYVFRLTNQKMQFTERLIVE